MKQAHHAAKGHAKKHTHAHKHVHHHHAKHHPKHHKKAHHHHTKAKVHTVGHHQQHAKGLAQVPGDVACCVSQALAASLQLQGLLVTDADVLALHRAAGADDEQGAPIQHILEAASRFGLAGARIERGQPLGLAPLVPVHLPSEAGVMNDAVPGWPRLGRGTESPMVPGLILGLDLPEGSHAVTVDVSGDVWSWGELYCLWCEWPDAVIDEAWAVSWQ